MLGVDAWLISVYRDSPQLTTKYYTFLGQHQILTKLIKLLPDFDIVFDKETGFDQKTVISQPRLGIMPNTVISFRVDKREF